MKPIAISTTKNAIPTPRTHICACNTHPSLSLSFSLLTGGMTQRYKESVEG